ncbi:MAG: CDP-alcohol phosphatidyltransferase family protein [Thaumarchaeota archaeon]|nr:CDP-alcohol phosphatidyltransferase family protein [Nitrososphaerota archaeon]
MLDKLRGRVNGATLRVGRAASRVMPSPTSWTVIGALFSILAAAYFATGGYRAELTGGFFVLVSGFFDILDGAVARATNRISKRGSFLDSTLDRVGETSIYLGILIGNYTSPVIVFLALSCSLLVSYARAKADSLSINLAGVGIGERSERLSVLVISSLLGILPLGVLVVAGLAAVTFAARVVRVTSSLKDRTLGPASG